MVAPVGFSGVTPFVHTTGISARKFNSHCGARLNGALDPEERRIRFDAFGRALLGAWTGGFGIAVKKLDLAQRLSWVVAGPDRDVGGTRGGKYGARDA